MSCQVCICPECFVQFSTPYLREAFRLGEDVWCPRGHRLEFRPPHVELMTREEQVAELERRYAVVAP